MIQRTATVGTNVYEIYLNKMFKDYNDLVELHTMGAANDELLPHTTGIISEGQLVSQDQRCLGKIFHCT